MFSRSLRSLVSSSSRLAPSQSARLARSSVFSPTLQRYLSSAARTKLEIAVKEKPIVLFMKGDPQLPQCGFSRAVVQLLEINGVPLDKLKTYDVLEDSELRNDVKEFSEWPTIPQVYVDGEFVGGCDIILGMHQSGELEALLKKHKIIADSPSESPSTT